MRLRKVVHKVSISERSVPSIHATGGLHGKPSSRYRIIKGLFFMIFSLVVLDVSMARIRYHYHLITDLSPIKTDISLSVYEYHGNVPIELKHCHAFDMETGSYVHNCTLGACEQNAYLLSEKRQAILHSVRGSHPVAEYLSKLFDNGRGMDQGDKIAKLFKSRSCESIIASSDKTNVYIDSIAVISALTCLICMWFSVQYLLRRYS